MCHGLACVCSCVGCGSSVVIVELEAGCFDGCLSGAINIKRSFPLFEQYLFMLFAFVGIRLNASSRRNRTCVCRYILSIFTSSICNSEMNERKQTIIPTFCFLFTRFLYIFIRLRLPPGRGINFMH